MAKSQRRAAPVLLEEAVGLLRAGSLEEAADLLRRLLRDSPNNPDCLHHLGLIRHLQGDNASAAAMLSKAATLGLDGVQFRSNLSVVLKALGRFEEAIDQSRRAIALNPDYAEAHNNLGLALSACGRPHEALCELSLAISLKPDFGDAYANLGDVLQRLDRLDEALGACRSAVELRAMEQWNQRRLACDWEGLADEEARLLEVSARHSVPLHPGQALNMASTPEDQLRLARRWAGLAGAGAGRLCEPGKARGGTSGQAPEKRTRAKRRPATGAPAIRTPDRRDRPIRLGYLSSDYHDHATAYLIAELIERHDRSRFTVAAYSFGAIHTGEMRRRLMRAFDSFADLRHASHETIARRIYEDGTDILLDLKGYTTDARPQIAAWRPAPVQVSFLGYPGTMGAGFIDYIIGDAVVTPMDQQPFFAEKIVQLPHCYQPNDTRRQIAPRTPGRADCGLPETGFVFCSFNQNYKLTPVVFDIWMLLLKAAPDAVLWLRESFPESRENLRREAAARGVDPRRLVFALKAPLAEHLARHRLADLFLDTLPINAHTTASDALWAGLPVLTCAGPTFAGRVAASLLHAVGLPELATGSLEEYEAAALRLVRQPEVLAGLRARLEDGKAKAPLFDTERYTRHLEAAFVRMAETAAAGRAPEAFAVGADDPADA